MSEPDTERAWLLIHDGHNVIVHAFPTSRTYVCVPCDDQLSVNHVVGNSIQAKGILRPEEPQ